MFTAKTEKLVAVTGTVNAARCDAIDFSQPVSSAIASFLDGNYTKGLFDSSPDLAKRRTSTKRHTCCRVEGMRRTKKTGVDDEPALIAQQHEPQRGEVWWYRQGAFITTGIVAVALWFTLIGPKEFSPKTEMVDPAADALNTGVPSVQDLGSISKTLQFTVKPPDLRQLGGKLTRAGTTSFGGQKSAVFQYQYGKSEFLLYVFDKPSKLFKDMKKTQAGKNLFYVSSGGAVSVVAWKDRRFGYYSLAAKATEKDLVNLAAKVVAAF
jgi:hypothetical protein